MATTTLTVSRARLDPLALWHLLSLDAPTVATLWTVFAARALHTAVPFTLPISIFVAVWLLYAADRLLDSHPVPHGRRVVTFKSYSAITQSHQPDSYQILEPRHLFHRRHRIPFTFAILMAAFALAILVPTLPSDLLRPYLLLAGLLAAWLALVHLTSLTLPKELVPGLFFATAVFIPVHANPFDQTAFASLCILNCLYIYAWEHSPVPSPSKPRQSSAPAHASTRLAVGHLPLLALALALLSFATRTPIAVAVSLAASGLFALDRYRHRLPTTTLRAAADLVLLSPLLILPFLH